MNQAFQPMLATLVAAPFNRAGWVNEEKYDGIRALAYRRGDKVQLFSRNQKQLTGEFPEIVRSLTGISGGDFVLDGEIVAFDSKNISRFQLLQRRAIGKKVEPVFVVFDCLELNGKCQSSILLCANAARCSKGLLGTKEEVCDSADGFHSTAVKPSGWRKKMVGKVSLPRMIHPVTSQGNGPEAG